MSVVVCEYMESFVLTHSALWGGSKQFSKERPYFCPYRVIMEAGHAGWTLGTWDPQFPSSVRGVLLLRVFELCSGKKGDEGTAEVQATLRSSRRDVPTARHLQGVW